MKLQLLGFVLILCRSCWGLLSNPNSYLHFRSLTSVRIRSSFTPIQMTSSGDWVSSLSSNTDLYLAVDESIQSISTASAASLSDSVLFLFVSSIYETGSYDFQYIFTNVAKHLPQVKQIIGCTSGTVIGQKDPFMEPIEVEARSGISFMLAPLDATMGVTTSLFHVDTDEIKDYIKTNVDSKSSSQDSKKKETVTLILASDSSKTNLAEYINVFSKKENTRVFGGVASSVTGLQIPKLFIGTKTEDGSFDWKKYNSGIAGITFTGNVAVDLVVARSCVPVGPVFKVTECQGSEIMTMERYGSSGTNSPEPPLVQLDAVLKELSKEDSFKLKKELLIGLVATSAEELAAQGSTSIVSSPDFFGQKPTTFDAYTGSITVPSVPKVGWSFQYCIRDSNMAKRDLMGTLSQLRSVLERKSTDGNKALALFFLGSVERGNKVFRYGSLESTLAYAQLKDSHLDSSVPLSGLFTNGIFAETGGNSGGLSGNAAMDRDDKNVYALSEADAVYAVLSFSSTPSSSSEQATASSLHSPVEGFDNDIMNSFERKLFNDEEDGCLVTKRDPDSTHPVR